MPFLGRSLVDTNVEEAVEFADRNGVGPIAIKTSVPSTAERRWPLKKILDRFVFTEYQKWLMKCPKLAKIGLLSRSMVEAKRGKIKE